MDQLGLFNSPVLKWVVLPLLIFTARVLDVSLGTMRIIFVSRGNRFIAPVVGFFEVIIWLLAIGQIMHNITNWLCYVAYGGGFALGNYIGILIEERLALGTLLVRVITTRDTCHIVDCLQGGGYGVTSVEAQGVMGPVKIILTVIKRKDLHDVVDAIQKCDPKAFLSVEEIRSVSEGVFPTHIAHHRKSLLGLLRMRRKAK
jgi:uncharacterized protein YebE (UPF0316 family)